MKRTLFYTVFFIAGCVENFDPAIDTDAGNLYFVDGIITNMEPAIVRIGQATAFGNNQNDVEYFSDANVVLYDDHGNQEQLYESGGFYFGTTPGVIGRSYSIEIQLPNGDFITSTPQLIKTEVPVGDPSLEQAKEFDLDGIETTKHGLRSGTCTPI